MNRDELREAIAYLIDGHAIRRLKQARAYSVAHGDPADFLDGTNLPPVERAYAKADEIVAMIIPEETGGWRESVEAAARAVLREMAPGIKDAAIAHVERNQEPVWLDALRYASAALAAAPKAPGGDDSPAAPYGPETGWNDKTFEQRVQTILHEAYPAFCNARSDGDRTKAKHSEASREDVFEHGIRAGLAARDLGTPAGSGVEQPDFTSNVHHLAAPNNTVGMCTAAEAKFVVVFKDGTWRYEPNALEAEISSSDEDFLVCVPLT